MIFRLLMQTGIAAGTEYPLEKPDISLGRDLGNDIVINESEISRRHAHLFMTGDTYAIEDLGSTNGTYVAGQRINAPILLNPGSIITFGEKTTFKFEAISLDPDATVAVLRRSLEPDVPQYSGVVQQITPPPTILPPVQSVTPPYVPPVPVPPRVYPPQVAIPLSQAQVNIPRQPIVDIQPAIISPEPMEDSNFEPRKRSAWLTPLLIVLGIVLVFCVIPWIIIEITNSYCALFPGFFNFFNPGVCP